MRAYPDRRPEVPAATDLRNRLRDRPGLSVGELMLDRSGKSYRVAEIMPLPSTTSPAGSGR
ncbi:hypothetical protein SAMN05216174_103154 [Actinokineospora iranica]|uniref:Uncharacterized protein n=1 Tax=Actinokineospora iranica TaxID=1271860 RepID=A0A1G6N2B0_9PSEU|nr:hypothetical protein SAMN05216174_103154 [Actinokineospora iranica]